MPHEDTHQPTSQVALPPSADIAVVGAGAAGLMAAIFAARTAPAGTTVVALDGAKKIGAKILVAGGGRCNVTHHAVDHRAYAGWSRNAVKQVLKRFSVEDTKAFFAAQGVTLKHEDTGKLFPTTDKARTVLDALLNAAETAGAALHHPARVDAINRTTDGFTVASDIGALRARAVVLATGGKALPRTGSDGHGYGIARSLGHTVSSHVFPALVPLILEPDHPLRALSGLTLPARIELRAGTGKRLIAFENSTLCTHFGLSGPSVMDISRHYTDARRTDPNAALVANWLPALAVEELDAALQSLGKRSPARFLKEHLPERFALMACTHAGIDPSAPAAGLRREQRRALLTAITEMPLPVVGDRGFTHAEVTAGGIPLQEIDIRTMHSRVQPGLYACGEICDVDGRIGGFNFQWAWATGFIAGSSAALALHQPHTPVA
ncbi:MAG: NAD(P)/FAD-dependent oxidoreductase [Planctomycetota bacterium]